MKRIFIILLTLGVLAGAGTASALTLTELQTRVQSLLAQLAALQAEPGSSSFSGVANPPDSCKTWYDGCNTCSRSAAGMPLACTQMYCVQNAGAKCLAYFDSTGTTGTPVFCRYPNMNLRRGMGGEAVSALQQFLQDEGFLQSTATGYYGGMTETAVREWQAKNGLVSDGNAYTTGWGAVGPRTWSALRARCVPVVGGDRDEHGCIPSAGYSWCGAKNKCLRTWEESCNVPPVGVVFSASPVSGAAPLTVSFLAEGYANSWYENGNMVAIADRGERYIDFGDGTPALHIVCVNPTASTCAYKTTHTYTNSGTYTATLFTAGFYGIQNDATYGTRAVVAQQSITVGGGTVACPAIYKPVCGRPTGCANTCPAGMYCTMECRMYEPKTYSNSCMLQAAGAEQLYEGACVSQSTNQPPVISQISGPTTLAVNQTGTWSIVARDPENQSLSYSIQWGDEMMYPLAAESRMAFNPVSSQTSTFTHVYASAGTYTVQVTVTDAQGGSAQSSVSVQVGSAPTVCTMEYAPVCGRPPEPACRYAQPACMMPTLEAQTYGNLCSLRAAGATFLYNGTCNNLFYQ